MKQSFPQSFIQQLFDDYLLLGNLVGQAALSQWTAKDPGMLRPQTSPVKAHEGDTRHERKVHASSAGIGPGPPTQAVQLLTGSQLEI